MKRLPDDTSLRFLPSVLEAPEPELRYMKRRRRERREGHGDPLGGLALLFPLGIAFALAFVLAAFSGLGITSLLIADTFTVVTDPGGDQMQVVVKRDGGIEKLDIDEIASVEGIGTLVGSFYRLADGAVIWVPQSAPPTSPATPDLTPIPTPSVPELAPSAGASPYPAPPTSTATPTPAPTQSGLLLP